MKHKNSLLILTISLSLIICIALGILTRNSYLNNVDVKRLPDKISRYRIALEEDGGWLSEIYFDNNIRSLSQLKEKADVIVKVKPLKERKLLNQALLTKVQILEIYKNDNLKKGENIYIYEPTFLGNDEVYMPDGYIMQLDDQEYIFFLKKLKVPNGYKYKGKEKISYMPVSTIFGKYTVKETNTSIISEEKLKEGIYFSEIRNMDIVTTNSKILETYLNVKSDVEEMIRGG